MNHTCPVRVWPGTNGTEKMIKQTTCDRPSAPGSTRKLCEKHEADRERLR